MTKSVASDNWHRVAHLKLSLRRQVDISRHVYRGEVWYLLRNSLSGRNHRFNAAAFKLIVRLDGQNSVAAVWEALTRQQGDAVPTQDETIRLLGQLYEADLVAGDVLPSTVEVLNLRENRQQNERKQRYANPFSIRVKLCDPERILNRFTPVTRLLFNRAAFLLWLTLVSWSAVHAVAHWQELKTFAGQQLISSQNLLLLWLTYPLIKLFHEAGHALAVKHWGGEVHDSGLLFLALTPIPYVDASAASAFPEKQRRIIVAGCGMMVELLLAATAFWIWLQTGPGYVRSLAFNVMLIGGASTLLFNGNPLLRYDGYYVLADLLEIPNLAQRANRYFGYLCQRHLLRLQTVTPPYTSAGEKLWLLGYAPLSFCYRIAVVIGLIWMVSGRFFVIGILLAGWGVLMLLVLPALRTLSRFLDRPEVRRCRGRLLAIGTALTIVLTVVLFIVPLPLRTVTQGVVWLPEQAAVRAGTDFEVAQVPAADGQNVTTGEPLLRGVDPYLDAEVQLHEARLAELYANYNALPIDERIERIQLQEEIKMIRQDLQDSRNKRKNLTIASPADGILVLLAGDNLPGRFVRQGELVGYIVDEQQQATVRAVIAQADIGLIRNKVTAIDIRLAERIGQPLSAMIKRIVPAADLNLPSAALGVAGGGDIPIDMSDSSRLRALESFFQLDLQLPPEAGRPRIGGRVYVRFEHGSMPLAFQLYRHLQQLFIRNFCV